MLYFVQNNCKATDGPFHEATRNHFMKQLRKTHDGRFYYEATRNGKGWIIPWSNTAGNAKD
jgi:hypothetical protein